MKKKTKTPIGSPSKDHLKKKSKNGFDKTHPLEGDGILLNIYHFLWKKNKNLESCPKVRIPHTVTYEHNFPRGWFSFDEKNHELKKKMGKELDTKKIISEFTKDGHHSPSKSEDHRIVASYLSKTKSKNGKESISVEFFNQKELGEFMWKRSKKEEGILQKFVIPKGSKIERKNSVIQAIWTPHIFTCERRTNFLKLSDTRYSLYEKAVTYEGAAHYSTENFCSPKLRNKIEERCKSIVDHFKSTEHKNISRMVLYFKIDNKGKVWLLWGSCLRLGGKGMNKSLNLSPSFIQPEAKDTHTLIKKKMEPASPKSSPRIAKKKMKMFLTCPNCEQTKQNKSEITLEKIIFHYKLKKRNEKRRKLKQEKNEMTSEQLKEIQERKLVIEDLEDLTYQIYSHFLVMKYDEPFTFQLPMLMPEEMKNDLEMKLEKLGLKKNENQNFVIEDSSISIARFQREIEHFKDLLGGGAPKDGKDEMSRLRRNQTNQPFRRIESILYIPNSQKSDKVPKPIKVTFKGLTNESYKLLKKDQSFLKKTILVCDDCYGIFNTEEIDMVKGDDEKGEEKKDETTENTEEKEETEENTEEKNENTEENEETTDDAGLIDEEKEETTNQNEEESEKKEETKEDPEEEETFEEEEFEKEE